MRLLLDTNVLTRLCHPAKAENAEVAAWLAELLTRDEGQVQVCIPEISDYEARRGLLHVALRNQHSTTKSLQHLDQLNELLTYLPLSTPVMRRAAHLWAQSRKDGRPTAPGEMLDGDVILAAQALEVAGIVVTENTRHLSRFVPAFRWQEVPLGT
jgi:predicted nucleic acid-binding protein